MEKENKKIENEVTQEEYQTIEPDDIVLDDDSDMPEPQTKSYEKFMKCTDKFMESERRSILILRRNEQLGT